MGNASFRILCNPLPDNAQCADLAALYHAIGWGSPSSLSELRELFALSDYVLLAMDGERVVGMLRAEHENAQTTWLAELAVLPGYQARGIGRTLLRRFIDDHPQQRLYTDATDGVERFFKRHGLELRRPLVPGPRKG